MTSAYFQSMSFKMERTEYYNII